MNYPPNWPRCVWCGDHALDGHLTCGRVECSESLAREERCRRYALGLTDPAQPERPPR